MIDFNLNFFFKKNNFNKSDKYLEFFEKTKLACEKLYHEFENNNNEILKSFTSTYQKKIRELKKKINIKDKKAVIGFGGSSSGAKALANYLGKKIIFFDNLDYNYFFNFLEKENIKEYTFFLISKSGDTFETLALLNLLIKTFKKIKDFNIFESIIVVTDFKDSPLKIFCDQNQIQIIEHNSNIGGRFSILSETGILPFIEEELLVEQGSEKYLEYLKDHDSNLSIAKNAALILASVKKYNLDMYCNLLYNYKLKHFSYWFHQLHAESLGKNGFGLTPITSICPKDHHSMMQLYIDGPKNKFFNIFEHSEKIYFDSFSKEGFSSIEKFSPNGLLKKQFDAVVEVFSEKQIPFRIVKINNDEDPVNIIELFSYFLLETIILGYACGINPYDQPAVQLIKNKI